MIANANPIKKKEEPAMTISRLDTNKADYQPGDTAIIIAGGFAPGSEVTFDVQHVSDPGADGVYGTPDDEVIVLGGDGHDPWSVTDGDENDLDGMVNGQIITWWYVNPDDSLDQRFLLTASASDGWSASGTFTDGNPNAATLAVEAAITGTTDVLFEAYTTAGSTGTGLISSFVRLQAPGSTTFQSGYNTDGRPLQFDENSSAEFTYAITLSQVPLVSIDGSNYYQFNLDLNESDRGIGPLITLHNIKLFASGSAMLNDMDTSTRLFDPALATLLFDMDALIDVTVELTDWNSGSGTGDYRVSIPATYFAGVSQGSFIYLYSEFGTKSSQGFAAEGGFEEWFVVRQTLADLSIDKVFVNVSGGNGNDVADFAGDVLNYTVTVTNTGNVTLTNVVVTDPLTGLEQTIASLAAGASQSFHTSYILQQEDLDTNGGGDGDIDNTATATSDQTGPVTDSVEVPVVQDKSLAIDKMANVTSVNEPGKITYTYTVTNTGNAAISGVVVVDDNATPGDMTDDVLLESPTGDTDGDGWLDVGETWTYTHEFMVTQAMMDAGGTIVNIVTANGDDVDEATDTETVTVVQNPSIQIDKVTTVNGNTGDNLQATAGQAVTWTYTVTNDGNVTLTAVAVTDDNGTPLNPADDFTATAVIVDGFNSGDKNQNDTLDPGESWNFTASGTAIAGSYTNTGTVMATAPDNSPVADSDTSSYTGRPPGGGLIAPTNTTVQQYLNGTAQTFADYYASQNGVVQYGIKGGKISQTNPGVFFYYTGASGAIKGADADNNGQVDQISIKVDQSDDSSQIGAFLPTFRDVMLYKVNDLNNNGMIDADDTVSTIRLTSSQVTIVTSGTDAGDVFVTFTPDAVDSMYLLSIKYSTGSVVGNSSAGLPTVEYTFSTQLQTGMAYGAPVETGTIGLAPKGSKMMLDGEAGDGARAINEQQMKNVLKHAMAYWSEQGISGEQSDLLTQASIEIADLGGAVLGVTEDGRIIIDDDAAGHGWSLGIGGVAPNRVDLFSVLAHELGHVLGKDDEDMGNLLEVGERMLPVSMDADSPLPLPAQLLGMVGMPMPAPELPFA